MVVVWSGRKDVRKGKKIRWLQGGILGKGTCRGYREYSGDPIALYCVRTQGGFVLLGGECCFRGGVALGGRGSCLVLLGGCCLGGYYLGGQGSCQQDDQENQENQNPVRSLPGQSGKPKSCQEPARSLSGQSRQSGYWDDYSRLRKGRSNVRNHKQR